MSAADAPGGAARRPIGLWSLAWREAWHRRWTTVATLFVVAASVAGVTAGHVLLDAAERETRRVQRDLGLNLRLVGADVPLARVVAGDALPATLPEGVVGVLASQDALSINHLTAIVEATVERTVDDGEPVRVRVTGIAASQPTPGNAQTKMIHAIEPGTVELGALAAAAYGVQRGGNITIRGETLTVAAVLPARGNAEDLKAYVDLADGQRLLGVPGMLSEVRAIDCLCLLPEDAPQEAIQREIDTALRDAGFEARVVLDQDLAETRARQRQLATSLAQSAGLVGVGLGAAVVAGLAYLNARQRRGEVALLQSTGRGVGAVLGLFAIKAAVIALVGAALGLVAGAWFGKALAVSDFPLTGGKAALSFGEMGLATGAAAIVSIAAALAVAVTVAAASVVLRESPAAVLTEDH